MLSSDPTETDVTSHPFGIDNGSRLTSKPLALYQSEKRKKMSLLAVSSDVRDTALELDLMTYVFIFIFYDPLLKTT